MPTTKLTCPDCGHDGTPETSRPLGSYGFNYLAEGIVCREVSGYDHTGRMELSAEIDCGELRETGARIECRSCWRTFPIPEGLVRTGAPDGAAWEFTRQRAAPRAPQPSQEGNGPAVESTGRKLKEILGSIRKELEGINAAVQQLEGLAGGLDRDQASPDAL